jgi:hypothetical protein
MPVRMRYFRFAGMIVRRRDRLGRIPIAIREEMAP